MTTTTLQLPGMPTVRTARSPAMEKKETRVENPKSDSTRLQPLKEGQNAPRLMTSGAGRNFVYDPLPPNNVTASRSRHAPLANVSSTHVPKWMRDVASAMSDLGKSVAKAWLGLRVFRELAGTHTQSTPIPSRKANCSTARARVSTAPAASMR